MATKALKSGIHLDRADKMLTFGATNTVTSAGTYPCGYSASYTDGTVLDLGNTDLEGMNVIFHVDTAFAGLTSLICKVLVSNDNGSNWSEIAVSPSIAANDLALNAEFAVAIPRGHKQGNLVKAAVTSTGTGTAGKMSAFVDTYIGK